MPAAMDGEPTGRLEALELAMAEGAKARAAASTASSMARDQWSPTNAAQVRVQGAPLIRTRTPAPAEMNSRSSHGVHACARVE